MAMFNSDSSAKLLFKIYAICFRKASTYSQLRCTFLVFSVASQKVKLFSSGVTAVILTM